MCDFYVPWQDLWHISPIQKSEANEIKNGFLGLSRDTQQGTQQTCLFSKQDNFLLSFYTGNKMHIIIHEKKRKKTRKNKTKNKVIWFWKFWKRKLLCDPSQWSKRPVVIVLLWISREEKTEALLKVLAISKLYMD